MMKRMKAALVVSALTLLSASVLADSDRSEVEELKGELQALQARVNALEARQTFTSFMPNIAERFHVMHRAGEAGDWAVASHELEELKRITSLSPTIDEKKGRLMIAMMGPSFDALEEAIEHGNHEKFEKALSQTINTCNSCHVATGSEFVEVTLDAEESLSMRHPHRFMRRDMPSGHAHGHAAMPGMGGMMQETPEAKPHHDDTGMPAHKHH